MTKMIKQKNLKQRFLSGSPVAVVLAAGVVVGLSAPTAAQALTIAANSLATFTGSVTATTLTMGNGAVISLGGGGFTTGQAAIVTTGLISASGSVTVHMPTSFTTGSLTIIDGSAGGVGTATYAAVDTALFTYNTVTNTTNDTVIVTVTRRSTAAIAANLGTTTFVANALSKASSAVATGDATALTALDSALNAGGATAKQAAEEVAVQADALSAGASVAVGSGGQVIGVASNRLASLRTGAQYASAAGVGFNTGDDPLTNAAWIKPFGNMSDQDESGGVAGFEADTAGVAAGIDTQLSKAHRVGASFAYSLSDVDGEGAGRSQLDIQSYQVTLYGDYTTKAYYVEGMIGYALNRTETSRSLTFGGLNRTASGDYDSNQYMLSVGGGIPFNVASDTFFTPTVGLAYTHVTSESYTETGAGNLNLIVDPDDVDAIIASIGGKLATTIKSGSHLYTPELRIGVSYDIAGDEATATGTYTGGGAAFTTTGTENEELAGNVGLGLTLEAGQGVSLAANYDADIKDAFLGHSASLEVRFRF